MTRYRVEHLSMGTSRVVSLDPERVRQAVAEIHEADRHRAVARLYQLADDSDAEVAVIELPPLQIQRLLAPLAPRPATRLPDVSTQRGGSTR